MTQVKNSTSIFPDWLPQIDLEQVLNNQHHNPHFVLGKHIIGNEVGIIVYRPWCLRVEMAHKHEPFERIENTDLFVWRGQADWPGPHYQLRYIFESGETLESADPFDISPTLPEMDLHLFGEGNHWHAYNLLGAHQHTIDGVDGTLFAVWAPNARRVSVIGNFNGWDGRIHPMQVQGSSGVWSLFIPALPSGEFYKYEILNQHSGELLVKTDPYAQEFEKRPGTAARVSATSEHTWQDDEWLLNRKQFEWWREPVSIYELHLGAWQFNEQGEFLSYRELADRLPAYVLAQGFTHVELMPVMEHPLDESWGYQSTGYFAPTSRFGTVDDFKALVDAFHQQGLGVILDWVPGHFPKDSFALARFDGSTLYEYADPKKGEHPDWGTLVFDYGRNEVRNFLLSSAMYWFEEFHIDGLRVDAVASMIYLDYSREAEQWTPNEHGGREHLEAIAFLQQLNTVVHDQFPGTMMIAEESTAWPGVTQPVHVGGLGFGIKWNMGWMNDTLAYFEHEPIHRKYHHNDLIFWHVYAWSENFMLPLSHDEVVHGKGSILDKMPGDHWQKRANARLLYLAQWTTPGKKLLFMGAELGQWDEWNVKKDLPWNLLDYPDHQGIQNFLRDLNTLYRQYPALHRYDFDPQGFEWLDCHDVENSVISFIRAADGQNVVIVMNLTPVPRDNYRIGLPHGGRWAEALNSDASCYGGSNLGNNGALLALEEGWAGRSHSAIVTLPPLAGLILIPE